jgi:predicted DCC family thiol-disulfide oxidoreductase YuxK
MNENKVKIFFDGNCIVCDSEISHYHRIAPEVFEMVDISRPDFLAQSHGLDAKAVNENLHVQTEKGEIKIGVDAFAHIWSKIPRYSFASRMIRWPGVYGLAKIGYWIFAKNRHLLPKKKNVLDH